MWYLLWSGWSITEMAILEDSWHWDWSFNFNLGELWVKLRIDKIQFKFLYWKPISIFDLNFWLTQTSAIAFVKFFNCFWPIYSIVLLIQPLLNWNCLLLLLCKLSTEDPVTFCGAQQVKHCWYLHDKDRGSICRSSYDIYEMSCFGFSSSVLYFSLHWYQTRQIQSILFSLFPLFLHILKFIDRSRLSQHHSDTPEPLIARDDARLSISS